MEALSFVALIGIYLWLDLHPFEAPPENRKSQDPQLN